MNRFNIVKQSKDYDADGSYVRHWLPELKDVPDQFVHEPWRLSLEDQERYGVRIGPYGAPNVDYPNPPKSRFVYGGDGGSGKGGGRKGGGKGGGGRGTEGVVNRGGGGGSGKGKGRNRSLGVAGRGGGRRTNRVQYGAMDVSDFD